MYKRTSKKTAGDNPPAENPYALLLPVPTKRSEIRSFLLIFKLSAVFLFVDFLPAFKVLLGKVCHIFLVA